jgi:hypothetical protein
MNKDLIKLAETMESPKRCGGLDYFHCSTCDKVTPHYSSKCEFCTKYSWCKTCQKYTPHHKNNRLCGYCKVTFKYD